MANPDIYLLFGVARGGAVGGDSEKQIRSDLEDIINKINDDKLLKVKIGLDEKSVEGMKDSLESGLNLKGKKIAVKTELDTAAIKGIQKQVGDMLTKLGETAAQSETHLKGIVDLLSEINSKPFSASLNFSDANTGVETLGRYREAVRDYVREMRDGYDAIAKIASHPLWKSSGLEDTFRGQIGSLYGSDFEKAIPKFEKRLDASSSLAGVERVAKDALVYWQQLLPILTKAQEIGIISAESKFGIIPEIPQESVGVASQLADLFTQISQRAQEAATASKPVTDEMTQALEGERQAADALSDEYNEHVSAVKAAAEAELLKAQQSAELASALGNEQKALDGVEDAASGEGKNVGKNVGLYHEYLDLITKIENALHRTGGVVEYSGEAYDKLTAHLVELKGHLKDGQESTEEFSTALKNAGYNSEQALGEAKTALKEYNLEVADAKLNSEGFENATKELKNSFTLYKQMNDLAGKMRVAIGKGAINNSDLEQYKELETAYSRLANIIYECEGDVEKFGSAVKAAGYDGSVEIKRAQAAMASYNRVLNENARAGRDAADKNKEAAQSIEKSQKIYQQFVSILTRMRSALNGGETTMASSAYYAALNEQWLKLSGIISGCSGNAQEFGEYIKEAGIDAEQTISEAATSLAEYKLALENMKPAIKAVAKEEERAAHDKADAERTATEAAKQRNKEQQAAASLNIKTERLYYSQLNAVRTMLLRVQNDLSRYSAAKTGRASGAYRELENQVEALKSMQGALISSGKPLDNFQKLMGSVRVNTKGASDAIVAARENTKSFADRFSGLASKFSMWFSATRVIMAVVRSIRQMVSASVELDSALTQMQIVTKANTDEMEKFAQSASQSAKEIGSSISDFISSATTFARLGYDAEESSILARYTAMLQNVGDIDVSDAQDAITAIVKVFDVKMDDIESIMDRLVTVGNNFPISVSEIAEGMNNVSSAMHAAGNDFNQTVALLTAANTSVQNISKASTGLRTIAARIRNMKTELDDLGEAMTDAEYDKLVQALTDASVSLTDQQGNLRSTYDILADIAAVWDSIDPNKQAAIAETLSGTRQQNVYDSIIGQFQEATGAMEAMGKNSAGALQEAYEVFLNSIQGHLNQFKAAFESLSRSAAEGDFIKSIIDIGIKLIEILSSVSTLTNRIGGLNTALYTTASIIAVIKAEAIVTRLQRVADWFRAITTYVAQLKTVYKSFHSGQALVVQGTNNFSAALKGLGITASAAQLSVAGLAAAIGGLLIVINLVRQAQEKAQQQKVEAARAEAEAAEKAEENASNILGLYSAYQTAEKGTKDFRDASLELAKALNEEVSDGVTGVTEDLNELSEAALRAAHTSAITARDLAGSALVGEVSGRFTFGKQSNNLYNLADELPLHFTSNQKLNDLIKTTLYEIAAIFLLRKVFPTTIKTFYQSKN